MALKPVIGGTPSSSHYRLLDPNGGDNPLWLELSQFLPLKIVPQGGMVVGIYIGIVKSSSVWKALTTTVDLNSYIPSSSDHSVYVLLSVNLDGNLVLTAGTPVLSEDISPSDIPDAPAETRYILGAVRLYYGQTEIVNETEYNKDILDLRFPMWHTHTTDEITDLDTGSTNNPRLQTVSPDGAWCWFADPRAIYKDGITYFGYVDSLGNVKVRQYDHIKRDFLDETTLHSVLEVDDHIDPGIIVRASDKKVLAFYSQHVGSSLYERISSSPEDTTTWDAEVDIGSQLEGNYYTYPSPLQLTGEIDNPIYLFFRHHVSNLGYPTWAYSKSIDGGITWSPMTSFFAVIGNFSPYFKISSNGVDRIDFFCSNGHPDEAITTGISLFHFYYKNGHFYKSDGTQITVSPPFGPSDVTLVYDGTTVSGWVWDVVLGNDDKPVVVYTRHVLYTDIRYNYARWSGSEWVTNEIVASGGYIGDGNGAGEKYYAGGVVLDHNDPTIVYYSKQVGSYFEIYRAKTKDNGESWDCTAITRNSVIKNIRPVPIIDHALDLVVLWMGGSYTGYMVYDTTLMGVGEWENEGAGGAAMMVTDTATVELALAGGILSATVLPDGFTLDQVGLPANDLSLNNKKITNLADPASDQDAASKYYVDTHGLSGGGKYRQFLYSVSDGDFTILTDTNGNPLSGLLDLE